MGQIQWCSYQLLHILSAFFVHEPHTSLERSAKPRGPSESSGHCYQPSNSSKSTWSLEHKIQQDDVCAIHPHAQAVTLEWCLRVEAGLDCHPQHQLLFPAGSRSKRLQLPFAVSAASLICWQNIEMKCEQRLFQVIMVIRYSFKYIIFKSQLHRLFPIWTVGPICQILLSWQYSMRKFFWLVIADYHFLLADAVYVMVDELHVDKLDI